MDCGALSEVSDASSVHSNDENKFGDTVTYTCNSGYEFADATNAMRTCQADATWSNSDAVCQGK